MNFEQTINYQLTIVVPFHKLEGTEEFFNWISELHNYLLFKVIVVIDSDDQAIFARLKSLKLQNLELITKKVGAPGLARNLALLSIRSEYVMFADSDDFVYLNSIMRILDKPRNSDLIVASYEKLDMKTKKLTRYKYPSSQIELAIEPALWRIIFKSSEIKNLEFTQHRMAEDQIFFLHCLLNKKKITSTGEVIYRYLTNHKGQISDEKLALKELDQAIDYLDLNDRLISTTIGSYVYVKLNFSLGLRGVKKLFLKRFPLTKLLKVFVFSIKMKKHIRFESNEEFYWSNND